MFLQIGAFKNSQILREQTFVRAFFEIPTLVYSREICEIFKDTFFYRTPPMAASEWLVNEQKQVETTNKQVETTGKQAETERSHKKTNQEQTETTARSCKQKETNMQVEKDKVEQKFAVRQ